MKRIIRNLKNSGNTAAMLVGGVNILPFAGFALLLCTSTAATVFGIIFLILGLFMWSVSFK